MTGKMGAMTTRETDVQHNNRKQAQATQIKYIKLYLAMERQ
jgi:hypothetical protein